MLNFNSGPAALPAEVLQDAAKAVREYKDSGISLLGMPHRGVAFTDILVEAKALTLSLLGLNDGYEVLWMQGGGRMQFALIPMNFLGAQEVAGYVDSGHWAAEAIKNASFYGKVKVLASSRPDGYRSLPLMPPIPDNLSYVHLTSNNTIYGTQFNDFPDCRVPLVADMSSELFSRRLDYSKFDLIYAVAQKNIGPAGVTLVVIKKELLHQQKRQLPGILSYRAIANSNSVYNTPPVFAIYCCLLTLRWLSRQGGVAAIERKNDVKARLLYTAIDESTLFKGISDKHCRSKMNVCFTTGDKERDVAFVRYAATRNITGIAGHRSIGGIRVALYNAITDEEVRTLIAVMAEFSEGQVSSFT